MNQNCNWRAIDEHRNSIFNVTSNDLYLYTYVGSIAEGEKQEKMTN